jgi:hypothetical protein
MLINIPPTILIINATTSYSTLRIVIENVENDDDDDDDAFVLVGEAVAVLFDIVVVLIVRVGITGGGWGGGVMVLLRLCCYNLERKSVRSDESDKNVVKVKIISLLCEIYRNRK